MRKFSFMEAATAVYSHIAAARQRRQTRRILESLPEYVRKDIGLSGVALPRWPLDN